jgi:hypothetical protein
MTLVLLSLLLMYVSRHFFIKVYKLYKIYRAMEPEIEEVERLLNGSSLEGSSDQTGNPKREKLSSLANSGLLKEYTGKLLSQDQLDKLDDDTIDKLYAKYEETLGKKMSKPIAHSLITLYTKTVNHFKPVDEEGLREVLSNDPVIMMTLERITPEIYSTFGILLAPVMLGMHTYTHFKNDELYNDDERTEGT